VTEESLYQKHKIRFSFMA